MKSVRKNILEKVAVIILTAGNSSRFGKPKALLHFDETNSFLRNIILEYYSAGIMNVVIVANQPLRMKLEGEVEKLPEEMKIKMILNTHPERGRFSSIKLGASLLENSDFAFVQNIDNPFTSSRLIKKMCKKAERCKFVVPAFEGAHGHPVLLSGEILKQVLSIENIDANFRDVLSAFQSVQVDADNLEILANINTQKDYIKYFHHVAAD